MTVFSYGLLLLFSLVLPIGAGILLSRKCGSPKPALLGAGCFVVFQLLTRIPLLQYLLPMCAGYVLLQAAYPTVYLLLLALSAGIFEECGRYIVMRAFLQKSRLADALAFGVGHGGIEAILLVGINSLALLFTSGRGIVLYAGADFLAAGIERLFAMTAHIGFSVLVWCSVTYKKPLLLPAAVLLHGVLDFVSVFMRSLGAGVAATETVIAAMAVCIAIGSMVVAHQFQKREGHIS